MRNGEKSQTQPPGLEAWENPSVPSRSLNSSASIRPSTAAYSPNHLILPPNVTKLAKSMGPACVVSGAKEI